jgi:hypothetical protein
MSHPMLEDDDRFGLLSEEFRFAHLFCERLHDRLIDIHNNIGDAPFNQVEIEFRSESDMDEVFGLEGQQLIDWLEYNDYGTAIGDIMIRRFFPALVGDMCQFIFEGLDASKTGKTRVAFALFRRPLKDNLFYLEWMAADPNEMLNRIYHDAPEKLIVQLLGRVETALPIISEVLKRSNLSETFDPEFIWSIRFDKSAHYGFEQYWNRALHLVTHVKTVSSGKRNMNFIFDDEDDRIVDWQAIYALLPVTLLYAVEVCELIAAYIAHGPLSDYGDSLLHRSIGFILWGRERARFRHETAADEPLKEIGDIGLTCVCGFGFVTEEEARAFYLEGLIVCPRCRRLSEPEHFLVTT